MVPEVPDEALILTGFSIARYDRPTADLKSKHGGVLIAYKNHIQSENLSTIPLDHEHVALKISSDHLSYMLCCIYNPPQNSPYRWKAQELQLIVKSLNQIQLEQNCGPNVLVGDINFSETNWKTMDSSNAHERLVLNTLSTLNYKQFLDGRKKQLDVLLTNKPESVINWKENRDIASTYNIEGKACSDRVAYEFLLNLQAEPCAEPGLETYAFKKADWSAFNDNIREEPFAPYCYSNVNALLRQWYIWLWEKLRKLIPRVTSHRASLPPWVTSSTSHQLKKLKTLKKRMNSTNSKSVRLLIKFKKMEKLLRQCLIEDQANYEERFFRAHASVTCRNTSIRSKAHDSFQRICILVTLQQRRIQQKLNFSTNISQALSNRMINTFLHLSLSHPRLPVGPDRNYAPNS